MSEQLELFELKCKYADRYKAIYPPKCNCLECRNMWIRRDPDTAAR